MRQLLDVKLLPMNVFNLSRWGTDMDSVDLTALSSRQKSIIYFPPRFMEYGTYRVVYKLEISGV